VQPSYEEARQRSDWPEWKKAIDVELQNLKEAGTWDVVERPSGVNIVDSKWVFRLKKNAEGKIVKWKAHLVARGFIYSGTGGGLLRDFCSGCKARIHLTHSFNSCAE
jgi:hypothetical protein